ncbi:MAG: AbrB/MazE/SpoVT family DNA-binding domain-containing protein [Desulfitobacteriaceae bacterium]|nr:AbrB/MazE/SpoVT family DNA-binding domain-containing protein [Desulfitobacteriaceae bacterium]MDD4402143.1 AbrB/MazE/SpoVT family DNA-binding domain-containing protein [Desulfitobacteriaceae bacterium]
MVTLWKYQELALKVQVTIPKTIRELLNLNEGDRVAFIEDDGKVVITKASLIALRELQDALSKEAQEKSITEEEVLNELEVVRKEMWNERKK